jgi:hypothetical protein
MTRELLSKGSNYLLGVSEKRKRGKGMHNLNLAYPKKAIQRQTEQEDPTKDMFGHEHQMMLVIIFIDRCFHPELCLDLMSSPHDTKLMALPAVCPQDMYPI